MPEEKNERLSFEQSLKKLENIVNTLESGSAELESAIELYTEGLMHKNNCETILKEAKLKIDKIMLSDGKPIGVQPFDKLITEK